MKDETVKLIECPRDAWQGLPQQIPTELKVRYLRALIAAGFRHLDAASFVSPKAVPQMADSEAVLAQLAPPNDVEIIGIVVNEKGAERAIATGAVTHPRLSLARFRKRFCGGTRINRSEENLAILTRIRERGRGERPRDRRLHLDGLRQSVPGPLEQGASRRSGASNGGARSPLDFARGYGRAWPTRR